MPDTNLPRNRPLVTVAMVTYNSEKHVAEAIESVLAQHFHNFELLICDDCSTDGTWQIVKSFSDRRIRAIRNETNIGEYPNRNKALFLARAKYFMFIDGDDYLYPHGLGFMASMMEKFPSAGFASAQPPSEKFIFPVELTPHEFCSCAFLGPIVIGNDFTQLLFRTESLRARGEFDLRYRSGDTHIQFLIGMRENCLLINGSLGWWRRHPGQASESLIRDRWGVAEIARYGREVLEHPDCPLSAAEKRLAAANLSRMVMRVLARYVVAGRFIHATRLLRRSGVPVKEWRCFFGKYARPYLSEINGANPIKLRIAAPVLPPVAARNAVNGASDFRHSMTVPKLIDRLTSRHNPVRVIKDDVTADHELQV